MRAIDNEFQTVSLLIINSLAKYTKAKNIYFEMLYPQDKMVSTKNIISVVNISSWIYEEFCFFLIFVYSEKHFETTKVWKI